MTTLMTASNQWANRPEDQRFEDLYGLRDSVENRKRISREARVTPKQLAMGFDDSAVFVRGAQGTRFDLTHFSFGQLAQRAHAPAGFLRELQPVTAALVLQERLEGQPSAQETAKLYMTPVATGLAELRAVTGPEYGRIYDADVVNAVIRMNEAQNGRWQVPLKAYNGVNSKQATTLYASDRDVFIFLVDEGRVLDVAGRAINRGFIVWNSEVGDKTFGIMAFTYDYVCQNRMIWGASNIATLKLRHTKLAPERFIEQAQPALLAYAESSSLKMETQLRLAKDTALRNADGSIVSTATQQVEWLRARGFTEIFSKSAVQIANEEEGQFGTVLDAVNGVTAAARSVKYTDERVKLETMAGNLLQEFAPADSTSSKSRIVVPDITDVEFRTTPLPRLTAEVLASA